MPAPPVNVRVTRQAAARQRLALQQQQQMMAQTLPPTGASPMAVEPGSYNLDSLAQRDPQLCHHYTKEIYSYLRDLELEHRVSPHFMQARDARARDARRRDPSPRARPSHPPTGDGWRRR